MFMSLRAHLTHMADHLDSITVDGLAVRGAFAAVGHPVIDELEQRFLLQHVVYQENPEGVIHFRWTNILSRLPAVRGRHLYDDLSDVYAAVETGPPGPAVGAAYDLTWLQERFWGALRANNMTMRHGELWHVCTAQAWRRKLMQRARDQKGWRRNTKGKLKEPIAAPVRKTQTWFH
jgi:hypothetical protein